MVRSDTDGQRVTLGDVADIDDGFEEANWFLTYQGEPAVGIQVFRVGDQSTLEVAAAARDFVQQRRQTLPKGASLSIIGDTSIMLKDRLTLMLKNLLSGAALVFAALIVFFAGPGRLLGDGGNSGEFPRGCLAHCPRRSSTAPST